MLDYGDVVERIAGNANDIGIIAGLELADLTGPAEQTRAFDHVGLENGQRLHAVFRHQHHLACLRAVWERTHIGPDGEGNAESDLLSEFRNLVLEQFGLRAAWS